MIYLLVVYHRERGLIRQELFDESQRREALDRRFEIEREPGSNELEIVVLGGASEAAIRLTHGRYFKTLGELAAAIYGER